MKTLFNLQPDFRVVRLRASDVWGRTDRLREFRSLLLEKEDYYPRIGTWLEEKVLPGIEPEERVAYIAYEDFRPVASAVLKRGQHAKFCHLLIKKEFQELHLGEVFFTLMTLDSRRTAQEIHFTAPEGLWQSKQEFFQSFGFQNPAPAAVQYRDFEKELRCSAPYQTVWEAALTKLPKLRRIFSVGGYSLDVDLVLSVKPAMAELIMQGKKRVEIRTSFSEKWKGSKVCIYAGSPAQRLVGEATISAIERGSPGEIWEKHGVRTGVQKEAYDAYASSHSSVFALILDDIHPYKHEIPIAQIEQLLDKSLRPPQSYNTLKANDSWAKAVSIAALLHGCLAPKLLDSAPDQSSALLAAAL